ncbi:type IV secretory system conjugative DNA transfer family protein [Curtobacterium flaccumfaciens]|uniref:type IV secretory system conjugative DNA transfer family protein n=1 Tax=Curtobacterium flaccumfaciens TaxID=2035 RepID=UPI001BDDD1FC|nr:TraM recognition domain-containing protein [Curtobacterium flaccumfaciens]MBT1633251.1 TraM recognition domain-containing protein [Curtobacterium flaccumfaciens pv. oortii]MCX2846899.1 TraM recognition domain-containing protein [Curtobacterium flaccumfaciens pv. oortii]
MKTTTPDPFQTAIQQVQWPWWGTPLIVLAVVLVLAGGILYLVQTKGGTPVDRMQRHMRRNNNLAPVLYARRRKDAQQLHPNAVDLPPGQKIGTLVGGGMSWVWQGWRDIAIYIFGPGRGKTTGSVVRHMLEAPGPAVMSTIKVDGVKEVLAGRKRTGDAWVYDPTQVYRHDQRPDFIYDPLWDVEDLTTAQELAAIFEASTKDADSKSDAQFDSQGRDLFAYALLAAKLEGAGLGQVYRWITEQEHDEIRAVMQKHAGHAGPESALLGLKGQPEKTRGSVYATAQRMASAIANDKLLAWTSAPGVRKFNAEAFVRSTDTAVLISRNGPGSGGAFVASLVRSISRAGERAAAADGGRITVPVVFELDEVANIVRWPELPDVVSFYGSMGLILGMYFQSWGQIVRVFGSEGADTLWSASSIRVYGGGESTQSPFLKRFSESIGNYDEWTTNTSTGRNGSTRSRTARSKPILPPDVLAHLPKWRAVFDATDVGPVLVRTRPWFLDKVLTAMIEGHEVKNGKIVKEKKTTERPSTSEGTGRVEPV